MEALHELMSVLCNPEGRVCINGSPADLEIIQAVLDALCADLAASREREGRYRAALEEIRDTGLGFELACNALKEAPE